MAGTRTEIISTSDSGTFSAHLAVPASGHGPGVLVIQEVFGGERVHPRRLHPGSPTPATWHSPPISSGASSRASSSTRRTRTTSAPAVEVAGRYDPVAGLADLSDALEHLRALEETQGATAVIGFCFGGTQAFRTAAHLDPACVVSYYGSGTADLLGDLDKVSCPVTFHVGDNDPYLPMTDVDKIRAAAADRNDLTVHVHEGGGHAFDNGFAPHFSQPEIASVAWTETLSFLFLHIGGPGRGA